MSVVCEREIEYVICISSLQYCLHIVVSQVDAVIDCRGCYCVRHHYTLGSCICRMCQLPQWSFTKYQHPACCWFSGLFFFGLAYVGETEPNSSYFQIVNIWKSATSLQTPFTLTWAEWRISAIFDTDSDAMRNLVNIECVYGRWADDRWYYQCALCVYWQAACSILSEKMQFPCFLFCQVIVQKH